MTLDLLAWHGLPASHLERLFAEEVFDFVLEAMHLTQFNSSSIFPMNLKSAQYHLDIILTSL